MKTIAEAISDLLLMRDTVVVPGLGAFVKKNIPAQVNPVANYFAMPSCVIEFNADLREENNLITDYIAEENGITEEGAKHLLAQFVSDCFAKLKNEQKVALDGLGTLIYDWHHDLSFEQDTNTNYNSDAFGLCDFTTPSIVLSKTKAEIKAEIEQQQKDKNTPITVDERMVHEDDNRSPRHRGWVWLLSAAVVFAAIAIGLVRFKIIDINLWPHPDETYDVTINTPAEPKAPVVEAVTPTRDTIAEPTTDTLQNDDAPQFTEEPLVEAPAEEPTETPTEISEPVVEEAKILIVAGCFSSEENALKLVDKLKNAGFKDALAEKHGSKWFVAFGRYTTDSEASEALKQIKSTNEGQKAWIRKG